MTDVPRGLDPSLLAAYATSTVDVWLPMPTRVAGPDAVPVLPFGPMTVITAWNPGSHLTPPAVNAQANADLTLLLLRMGATIRPALGAAPDGSWSEDSLAVSGLPLPTLLATGRAFGQHAVYHLTDQATVIVPCAGGPAQHQPRRD